MRFDFFRRPGAKKTTPGDAPGDAAANLGGAGAPTDDPAQCAEVRGYVTYATLLDPQKRPAGYRMSWVPAPGSERAPLAAHFKALVSTLAKHLNGSKAGWRLGAQVLFFDVTADPQLLGELQALPPDNVVLCMNLDDLSNTESREMFLFLREQGFRFMLCDAAVLPEDPELRSLLSYVDVGAGGSDIVALMRAAQPVGRTPMQLIATQVENWAGFDACAARRVSTFVHGGWSKPVVKEANHALQPESLLIVRLMQMIQRNEDVREIETALKRDAALTYRLLRHINSPAIGVGVEIHSLRHAVSMLGYSPLFRWLSLLLATSNTKTSSPYMMKRAIMRGRFVELMGQGMLAPSDFDNLFVVGMFSMIDQLLGVTMEEVLGKVQLTESVQQAILTREGAYGPFLALAETCEADASAASPLSESLFMSPSQVNAAHLLAMTWSQDVNAAEAAY